MGGAQATTAIEGNTLTQEQVQAQVPGRLHLPPSREYLATEVQNVINACNAIANQLREEEPRPLSAELICEWNRQILQGDVPSAEGAERGVFRKHQVMVAHYRAVPAHLVSPPVQCLCSRLDGPDFEPPKQEFATAFAILKATVAHLYLAWIHPFGDENGRTARLMEVFTLLRSRFPTLTAQLLSNHYNASRAEYYRQLDRTSTSGGHIIPFLAYATRGLADQLQEQIAMIQEQQIRIVWETVTLEWMIIQSKEGAERRHALLVALAQREGFTRRSEITDLTPQLAKLYASRTRRTLSRDLNALIQQNLIQSNAKGDVQANVGLLRPFIPGHL